MCIRKLDLKKNREGRIFFICVFVFVCLNDYDEKFCLKLGVSINF